MNHRPLYNGQNLDFTGNQNPYGLIQNGGKRKPKKSMHRKGKKQVRKVKKTKKYRR